MNSELVSIIFGMKINRARKAAGLTLTEFAGLCDLSPSYVTEIEKGRKYPKADKILRMADVLDKSYDELVSVRLEPSLAYLESALSSPLLQEIPFDAFELDIGNLINLLTQAPAKASALIHAILEIGRRYNMKEEHFLRAALRSYQELSDNFFPDLEEAAGRFMAESGFATGPEVTLPELQHILTGAFGYHLDNERLAANPDLWLYRSILIPGAKPMLLLNPRLQANQMRFLLAREIGYCYLKLQDRAYTSPPDDVNSFQQVFNDFRASYFAGAVLMPRPAFQADIQTFFDSLTWQPEYLTGLLARYNVTPEMLFYRFSELVPQFFGLKLHFLRFHSRENRYVLKKHLNMNRLLLPGGMAVHEHFCRRWLTIRLLRELQPAGSQNGASALPHVGIQLSEFYASGDTFLCLGMARPLVLQPEVSSSVIIGFRVDEELRRMIRFMADPAVPQVIISETCERCPLTEEQCSLRAVRPVILEAEQARQQRRDAVHHLMAELRT